MNNWGNKQATAEKLAWLLALLGLGAKWALVPAGNPLLLIGLGGLGILYFMRAYFPGDAAGSAKAPNFLDDYLRKVMGISASITFIGVLFKLLSWANGATLLVVGVATMVIALLVLAFNRRMNWFALAIAALGALMLYVPSETVVRVFHRDDPVLVEKMVYQLRHPTDPAAAADVKQYLQQKQSPK